MIACSCSPKKLQKVSKQLSSCNVLVLCHGYIIVCSTLALLPRIPVKCPNFCLISVLKTANFQRNETHYLKRLKELQVPPQYLMLQKNHLFKGLNLWWLWSEQIEVVNLIFKVVLKDLMWKVLCCYIGWELKWNINIWFLQLSY